MEDEDEDGIAADVEEEEEEEDEALRRALRGVAAGEEVEEPRDTVGCDEDRTRLISTGGEEWMMVVMLEDGEVVEVELEAERAATEEGVGGDVCIHTNAKLSCGWKKWRPERERFTAGCRS
jgi:hypothetical protein